MKNMLINDLKVNYNYGFVYLYIVVSLMYVAIIHILPSSIREIATLLIVFSDPSALGFFFMGAIILYEKSERVINYISITPVSVDTYILSKVTSLSLISVMSGLIIYIFSGVKFSILIVMASLFTGSIFFSLIGLIVASRIRSLNQFIMTAVPFQMLFNIPAVLYALNLLPEITLIYPTVTLIKLLSIDNYLAIPLLLVFMGWTGLVYYIARINVKKMFQELGGIKL